mmetsp:Transcript_54125/g.167898  ORF Transcript_54125/g.167898 Transcript_54125/m.167898 type:complete len:282 (-) Transcript_54125:39-884(-)
MASARHGEAAATSSGARSVARSAGRGLPRGNRAMADAPSSPWPPRAVSTLAGRERAAAASSTAWSPPPPLAWQSPGPPQSGRSCLSCSLSPQHPPTRPPHRGDHRRSVGEDCEAMGACGSSPSLPALRDGSPAADAGPAMGSGALLPVSDPGARDGDHSPDARPGTSAYVSDTWEPPKLCQQPRMTLEEFLRRERLHYYSAEGAAQPAAAESDESAAAEPPGERTPRQPARRRPLSAPKEAGARRLGHGGVAQRSSRFFGGSARCSSDTPSPGAKVAWPRR